MEENKDIKMTQELRQAVADIKAAILTLERERGVLAPWKLSATSCAGNCQD